VSVSDGEGGARIRAWRPLKGAGVARGGVDATRRVNEELRGARVRARGFAAGWGGLAFNYLGFPREEAIHLRVYAIFEGKIASGSRSTGAFFEILRQYIPAYSFARRADWEKRSGERECLFTSHSRWISRYFAVSCDFPLKFLRAIVKFF